MTERVTRNGQSSAHRRLLGFAYMLLPLLLFGAYVGGQVGRLSNELSSAQFAADARVIVERTSATVQSAEDQVDALADRLRASPAEQWQSIIDDAVDRSGRFLSALSVEPLAPRLRRSDGTKAEDNAEADLARILRIDDDAEWLISAMLNVRQLDLAGSGRNLRWCLWRNHQRPVFCSTSATVLQQADTAPIRNGKRHERSWRLPIDARRTWSVQIEPDRTAGSVAASIHEHSNLLLAFLVSVLLLGLTYLVKIRQSNSASVQLLKALDNLGDANTPVPLNACDSADYSEFATAVDRARGRVLVHLNLERALSDFNNRIANEANANRIVESLILAVNTIVPAHQRSIVLRVGDADYCHYRIDDGSAAAGKTGKQRVQLAEADEALLYKQPVGTAFDLRDVASGIRSCQPYFDTTSCFAFPIKTERDAFGFIIVANDESAPTSEPLLNGLRQLAERAALAFARCERETTLYRQAHFDSLTGLPNRVLLADRTNQALRLAKRHGNRVGLMFVDLDDFKRVNDSLGHSAGDKLLKGVADRLRTCIRESDAVARLAGDEFVVLISEINDSEQANLVVGGIAKTIKNAISRPFEVNGKFVRVRPSIGVAISNNNCADYEKLLQAADAAMYTAKSNGDGSIRFFRNDMSTTINERMNLETELALAIEKGQLTVEFQPLVSVHSERICGAEALLRWDHPSRGRISPARFIPLAEDSGIMSVIGNWALREAFSKAAELAAVGGKIPFAVNLSASQLKQSDMAMVVETLLGEFDIEPRLLCCEISESSAMHDTQHSSNVIGALNELGVKIALDDFGTSYSSLAYLSDMAVDRLKIDKRFIDDLALNTNTRAIINAIVGLGHGLGLEIVAEGVENVAQFRTLREAGVDITQGYYHAEPMAAEQLLAFIRSKNGAGEKNVVPFSAKARNRNSPEHKRPNP